MTFQDFRQYLESRRDVLRALSDDLWNHPELGFEEHHACATATDLLKRDGYAVTTPYCGLDTAFRAEGETILCPLPPVSVAHLALQPRG